MPKVLKISAICKQKSLTPLLKLLPLGRLFVKYHCIDIFRCCFEINNRCRLDPSNLEFDPLPQEKDTGCNQGIAKAKRLPTVTRWFSFELIQDGLGVVSSCAILLPDVDLTNERWLASSQTRSWADHQRYRWHQSWTACFIHDPFHHQLFSIHELNKLMSSLCYSPTTDMPACLWDIMAPRRHHITTTTLKKYVCVTAATVKKWCKAFMLADGGNVEHFLTSM